MAGNLSADVVICGAGIAGVSVAYQLAVHFGVRDVLLVDELAPLSLTSDHSTECYRNWWPGPGDSMVALMNRSIDLMEALAIESGDVFHLNRRGYLYCAADQQAVSALRSSAEQISKLGAGPLRIHKGAPNDPTYMPASAEGFGNQPVGADLIMDSSLLGRRFPYLSQDVRAALHVRRAGWLSAQQLGMYMLGKVRANGVRLLSDRVSGIELSSGKINTVVLKSGREIRTNHFVNAAGPFLGDVGRMLGVELPVSNELHLKAAILDSHTVLDRAAPLVIWAQPQSLSWTPEERQLLSEEGDLTWLLGELPSGVHTRPDGGVDSQVILLLWEYHTKPMTPVWPLPLDSQYPEIALRGLVKMIPGMGKYVERIPHPRIDGGYYTRTRENRPLIGRLPVEGAYVIGALSGFGIMASCAAGELLALDLTGQDLPPYAPAFSLQRYSDPEYRALLRTWEDSGQL